MRALHSGQMTCTLEAASGASRFMMPPLMFLLGFGRVWRLMKAAGLQGRHPRAWKKTTVHGERPVPAPDLIGRDFTAKGQNQRWCGDITYIKSWDGWVYLATVIDLHSRRVVGWELGEDLRAELALSALNRALADRQIEPGIVHHSDRGVQYCSQTYVERLQSYGFVINMSRTGNTYDNARAESFALRDLIQQIVLENRCSSGFVISMSRTGNPYDNARAESFMKTLKSEEVYLHQYRDQEDARASIRCFIEEVYNGKRLHSSLGYLSPAAFEEQHRPNPGVDGEPAI